jgi:cytidylate kinase
MAWILHDAYLLGDAATITLREVANGEQIVFNDFRRPGETDAQLDTRMRARIAQEIDGQNVYLVRRVNKRADWQPRNEPGK